jgi:hypothetical protein
LIIEGVESQNDVAVLADKVEHVADGTLRATVGLVSEPPPAA